MSNNEIGRPEIVFNDEQIAKIEELAKRLTIEQIAGYLGVGESTFFRIKNRDKRVLKAYQKGKASCINHVVGKLMQNIDNNDTASIIFFLKTQAGWSEKQQQEISLNNISLPIMIAQEPKSYEQELTTKFEEDESEYLFD